MYTSSRPLAAPAPEQYYVANCGTGAVVTLSRATAAPQSATSLGTLDISPDNKWVAFTSRAASATAIDVFALPADGSVDPVIAIPAVGATQVTPMFLPSPPLLTCPPLFQSVGGYKFTRDSRYLGVARTDTDPTNTRTAFFDAPMSSPISSTKAINLTPAYPNFPNGDPLALVGFPGQTFGDNGYYYTMLWPAAVNINTTLASPPSVYAISENGGDTVRLSWNSTLPALVNPQPASQSFRMFFFGDVAGTGLGGEAYVNQALASSLLPLMIGLVALLALAL